jgi:glycosyltransferase involved in cell wall biosynthesis
MEGTQARSADRTAPRWNQLGAPRPLGGTEVHPSRHLRELESRVHSQEAGGQGGLPEPVHQSLVGRLVPPARVPTSVIVNGVELDQYTPDGLHERPSMHYRLLIVEGSLSGGLDSGLYYAVELANLLARKFKIELNIAGQVDGHTKNRLKNQNAFRIHFMDAVKREHIPWLMRSSHLLFSAEVNPPCPNSVIEALACGLPVIGFDTGSLSELVQGEAGRLVPYGADQWKLERPDIQSLADAAEEVLHENDRFRRSAREHAEDHLGMEKMVDRYMEVLLN